MTNALAGLALAFSILPAVQHVGRRLHPALWGGPLIDLHDGFETVVFAESRWRIGGDARYVRVRGGGARIDPPPGSTAYVELISPSPPQRRLGAHWTPLGELPTSPPDADDELSWRAALRLDRDYFVVLEWEPLLVQRTRYGLHISYPNTAGQITGHEIHYDLPVEQTWRVARGRGQVTLDLDGKAVWSAPLRVSDALPRFGEARSDAQHGGSLVVDWVSYRRWLSPGSP